MAQPTNPVCLVCGKPNSGKQRLYCSKRCCATASALRVRGLRIHAPVEPAPASFRPAKCPLDCRYLMAYMHGSQDFKHHCGYIFMAGHSRGCDPGEGCIRYRKKRRKGKANGERAT